MRLGRCWEERADAEGARRGARRETKAQSLSSPLQTLHHFLDAVRPAAAPRFVGPVF